MIIGVLFGLLGVMVLALKELHTFGLVWFALCVPLAAYFVSVVRAIPKLGAVSADARGLCVGGELAVPNARILRATAVAEKGGAVVSIQRRRHYLVLIDLPNLTQAEDLVTALGFDARQVTATFAVDSPVSSSWPSWLPLTVVFALIAAIGVPSLLGAPLAGLLLGAALYPLLLAISIPATVTIGLDGVLHRWLWRRRMLPFSALSRCTADGDRLTLESRDGTKLTLRVRTNPPSHDHARPSKASRAAYVAAVAARIEQARAAHGPHDARLDVALLARGQRSISDWVQALRAPLLRGPDGFRNAAMLPERLWKTIDDAHAPPVDRAAAAVALGPALDATGRERLLRVAAVTALPRLRVAVEAAARDDEAALEVALEDVAR